MSRGALLIIAILLALLAMAVTFAVISWTSGDMPQNISVNGYIALALGGLGTLTVGGGLMALVFFSNRSGHDASVHRGFLHHRPDDDPPR